jgi:hypothetical protein
MYDTKERLFALVDKSASFSGQVRVFDTDEDNYINYCVEEI